jgi:hypothetical protein
MKTWTRTLLVGAALLAGCEGSIGGNGSPTGSGSGAGASTGSGTGNSTGSGTGNSVSSGTGNMVTTGAAGAGAGGSGPTPTPTTCTPGVPTTTQLPRLTRAEYDKKTRDLLGLDVQPSQMLAPDTLGSVDQRAWDGIQSAADSLATQVMANTAARTKVLPCTTDNATCIGQFITAFGQKAFRRPLTTTEVARFQALYTNRATITATGSFNDAVTLILKAFLLSPSFITRAEISETAEGANYRLDNWEIASRLSYTLWGTMPDDALFTAAQGGQLATEAQVLTQAQRMVMDPKARAKVAEFHMSYLHQGIGTRWSDAAHDTAIFTNWKAATVPLLTEETKRLTDYVAFDMKGTFQDLITKPIAFVNRDTAPLYGLPAANFGADLTMTSLDATKRAGLFTQVGFLASYSSFNRTSPILRGAFLQKDVLCWQPSISIPDGAFNTPLPTGADLDTNRKQVTAQTAGAACAVCHAAVVNPPGFALEAFDSVGASQTTERGTNAPLDTAADIVIGAKTTHVTGPVDLMAAIASSPEGQGCYAQRLVTFAYERALTTQDVCTVQMMAGKMGTSTPYSIVSMLTDLTQTQSFRYRAKELP